MAKRNIDENGWQDGKRNIKKRITHLFKNDLMSDFTLITHGVRIPVHKLVLASTSSVFYTMLYGPMAEEGQELDVSHYGDYECMSEFLKYVYTDEVLLSWENVFPILNLAKCYMISRLQKRCSEFMVESVTKDNVLTVLQQCLIGDATAAVEQCLQIIGIKASEILNQDAFLDLNFKSLIAILKVNTLKIKEIDLFLAVNAWCEYQVGKEGKQVCPESKKETLGEAINLIRFPIMSLKEFGEHCVLSGLLSPEETNNITYCLSLDTEDAKEEILKKIPFNKDRRKYGKEVRIDRSSYGFDRCDLSYYYCEPDAIQFTVNKNSFLTAFSLFGDPRYNTITDINFKTVCADLTPSFTVGEPGSGPEESSFRLNLKEPIEVFPNQKYEIYVIMQGPSSIGLVDCGGVAAFEEDGFEVKFFPHCLGSFQNPANSQFLEFFFEVYAIEVE